MKGITKMKRLINDSQIQSAQSWSQDQGIKIKNIYTVTLPSSVPIIHLLNIFRLKWFFIIICYMCVVTMVRVPQYPTDPNWTTNELSSILAMSAKRIFIKLL